LWRDEIKRGGMGLGLLGTCPREQDDGKVIDTE